MRLVKSDFFCGFEIYVIGFLVRGFGLGYCLAQSWSDYILKIFYFIFILYFNI